MEELFSSETLLFHGSVVAMDRKHHLSQNISVPLAGICILIRDTKNHIEKIEKRVAYEGMQ